MYRTRRRNVKMSEKSKESKRNISSMSMIDLKAELFRKQEEFRQKKLQSASSYIKGQTTEKKPGAFSVKNAGVAARASRDLETCEEDLRNFENARKILEVKTKLYDQMTGGSDIPEDDGSRVFLVDFQQKALIDRVEKRRVEDGKTRKDDHTDPITSWQNRDPGELTLMSDNMRQEFDRQKWEDETADKPAGPVHYSNVRHGEIRSHGVGFYEFSEDASTRAEQQQRLNNLREETMVKQKIRERVKEKRRAMIEARLNKVKQRKLGRSDPPISAINTDVEDDEPGEKLIGPEPAAKESTASSSTLEISDVSVSKSALEVRLAEIRKKMEHVREWDKGKPDLVDRDREYIKSREDERPVEFAPPNLYFENKQSDTKSRSRFGSNKQSKKSMPIGDDQVDIHKIGQPESSENDRVLSNSNDNYQTVTETDHTMSELDLFYREINQQLPCELTADYSHAYAGQSVGVQDPPWQDNNTGPCISSTSHFSYPEGYVQQTEAAQLASSSAFTVSSSSWQPALSHQLDQPSYCAEQLSQETEIQFPDTRQPPPQLTHAPMSLSQISLQAPPLQPLPPHPSHAPAPQSSETPVGTVNYNNASEPLPTPSAQKPLKILEVKTKLYDQMTGGSDIPEDDGSKVFLVDFQQKALIDRVEKRRVEDGKTRKDDHTDPITSWQNRDPGELTLMSDNMRREFDRQKWEDETADKPAGPVHYSNVRHGEIRSHGVGFYEFSEDASTREEQQQRLNNLREETMVKQKIRERVKEKRRAMIEARLNKVKQRKLGRSDLPISTINTDVEDDEPGEKLIGPEPAAKESTASSSTPEISDVSVSKSALEVRLAEIRKKMEHVREWDKGKPDLVDRDREYIKSREDERPVEFAPPNLYFENKQSDTKSRSRFGSNKQSKKSMPIGDDQVHIHEIGQPESSENDRVLSNSNDNYQTVTETDHTMSELDLFYREINQQLPCELTADYSHAYAGQSVGVQDPPWQDNNTGPCISSTSHFSYPEGYVQQTEAAQLASSSAFTVSSSSWQPALSHQLDQPSYCAEQLSQETEIQFPDTRQPPPQLTHAPMSLSQISLQAPPLQPPPPHPSHAPAPQSSETPVGTVNYNNASEPLPTPSAQKPLYVIDTRYIMNRDIVSEINKD